MACGGTGVRGAMVVRRDPVATLVSPSILIAGEQTVRNAAVTPEGDQIRWVELPGQEPPRVYVHGLGATSPAYFAEVAVHPLLAGRRSLLIDLLGHGISDRPTGFDYTLESHADALAAALARADVVGAELVAHSMGGSVAIVLAARHPHVVSRLVLVDANLDPIECTPATAGSSGIAALFTANPRLRQIYCSPECRRESERQRNRIRDEERARRLGEHPRVFPPASQPTAPGTIDPLAPTAVRNCPHCDQPVTIVALLATQEAARPTITNRVTDIVPLRRLQ